MIKQNITGADVISAVTLARNETATSSYADRQLATGTDRMDRMDVHGSTWFHRGRSRGVRLTMLVALVTSLVFCLDIAVALGSNYELHAQFGATGSGDGELVTPQGVAVDQTTHDVYVADSGNHRLEKFSGDGAFIAAWGWGVSDGAAASEVCASNCRAGLSGTGVGEFTMPTVVAVDNTAGPGAGDVYVADEGSNVVERFGSTGVYMTSLSSGSGGPFQAILGLAVDGEGNLWVYDAGGEIYEFSDTGTEIQQWNTGGSPSTPGLAVATNGHVYVQELGREIVEFTSAGVRLGKFGEIESDTLGLTVNQADDFLLTDRGALVSQYIIGETLPTLAGSFGEGTLTDGRGVGVDPGTGNVYVADESSDQVDIFTSSQYGSPKVTEADVDNVSTSSAEIHADIDTGEFATTYNVEYGTTEAYGSDLSTAGLPIGSGLDPVTISQTLSGLAPETTYHYRVVATNSRGVASGKDGTFTTWSTAESPILPDHRAYELVSPPEKDGSELEHEPPPRGIVATSGDEISYSTINAFGNVESARRVEYLSTRGAEGWSTQAITPRDDLGPSFEGSGGGLWGFSGDLSSVVFGWGETPLTPEAPADFENLYLRDNANGSYTLLAAGTHSGENGFVFAGASSDFSDVVFETPDALTGNAVAGLKNVYEWFEGQLSLVSVPPGSDTGSEGVAGSPTENGNSASAYNDVASNGEHVVWGNLEGQLYSYDRNAKVSVEVNASLRHPSLGNGSALFEGATSNGELVFFQDATPLTEGATDKGGLYAFDTSDGALTDLTPDGVAEPAVLGVVGFGENGAYVYFVAEGALANGAQQGQPNLYLEHEGRLSLIDTLSPADKQDWEQSYVEKSSMVTPDGLQVAFMSDVPLTGYENKDANSGELDSEVFEYNIEEAKLYCVSCNPSGEAPVGPSSVRRWLGSSNSSDYLSDNGGRLFFDSSDVLAAGDTNGVQNVYEWERDGEESCQKVNGCIYLLSNGSSSFPSSFDAATPNGNDVFITTRARLVPRDTDELVDFYDIRVDGGFSEPPSLEQCSGESCLAPLSAPPVIPSALTTTQDGENLTGEEPGGAGATFGLAAIGNRELRSLARTGRLTLFVGVSKAGIVTAKITMKRGHNVDLVASRRVRALTGEKVKLTLMLDKTARDALAAGRKIRLAIAVGYSMTKAVKHVTVTVDGRRTK